MEAKSIPVREKAMRAAFGAVGFPLTIAQYALSRRQWSKYKPPGQRTDIGPYKVHAEHGLCT